MNGYARASEVFADVAGVAAANQADLLATYLRTIEAESRAIDEMCSRKFYVETETRYFDGSGCTSLYFDDYSDILSITTLKVDVDGDGTYETTLAVSDYWLWPDNKTPKRRIDLNPEGDVGAFPLGRRRVQVVGKWGYSDLTESVGTLGEALDASETEITMAAGHTVEAGDTMIVGSEEIYVSAVSANTITVTRGINGTTAATADDASAVSIRRYPPAIEQAVKMRVTANRWDTNSGVPMGEPGRGYAVDYAKYRALISPFQLKVVA